MEIRVPSIDYPDPVFPHQYHGFMTNITEYILYLYGYFQ